MIKSNTFEGGTDTASITTGNSGGASGDAFNTVNGTLCKFSASQAYRSAFCCRVVDAVSTSNMEWSLGALTTDVFTRAYLYIAAYPGSGTAFRFMRQLNNLAALCNAYEVTSGGFVRAINAADGVVAGTTGAVQVALNQWVRIETRSLPSTTVGEVEWRLFNSPDSTWESETKSATGLVLAANSNVVDFGVHATAPTAPWTGHFDDIAVSDVGWIGPQNVSLVSDTPFPPAGRGATW